MSRIFKLYRLQQVDTKLNKTVKRLAEINETLGDDDSLQAAMQHIDEAKSNRIDSEKELRFVEEEVREQQIKVEQNQSRLYSGKVTNPKELQDLQSEAEAFKRQLSSLEDNQIEKMMAVEEGQSLESDG